MLTIKHFLGTSTPRYLTLPRRFFQSIHFMERRNENFYLQYSMKEKSCILKYILTILVIKIASKMNIQLIFLSLFLCILQQQLSGNNYFSFQMK